MTSLSPGQAEHSSPTHSYSEKQKHSVIVETLSKSISISRYMNMKYLVLQKYKIVKMIRNRRGRASLPARLHLSQAS